MIVVEEPLSRGRHERALVHVVFERAVGGAHRDGIVVEASRSRFSATGPPRPVPSNHESRSLPRNTLSPDRGQRVIGQMRGWLVPQLAPEQSGATSDVSARSSQGAFGFSFFADLAAAAFAALASAFAFTSATASARAFA